MSPTARPQTFGRRPVGFAPHAGAGVPGAAAESPRGERFEDLARRLARPDADEDECLRAQTEAMIVPWSGRAAFLAGLATAFLAAGAMIAQKNSLPDELGALSALAPKIRLDAAALAPAIAFLAILSAGRATFWTLLASHFILRRRRITSFAAFAGTSAAVVVLVSLLESLLGLGDLHALTSQALIAAGAGFFYRLFAGARPDRPRSALNPARRA